MTRPIGCSGLVREEKHPCVSNFIQSIFEPVQADRDMKCL